MSIVEEVAAYAKEVYPPAEFPHIAEVVAYGRQLARQMGADEEIVTIAAYFHDISRVTLGPEDHNIKSAEMAREWLGQHGYPQERIEQVMVAIIAHTHAVIGPERESVPLEGRILYDADKISRAQGMGLIGMLVHLGAQTNWEGLTYAQLAAVIRRGRELTEEAYHSLYTEAARDLAGPGYRRAIAFCDGLLQMEVFATRD
ncbi:MAG: HD domain-containing protein [Chloroflexi bacterium]|nr:HD domain-containing protein [Chloroflexota bacterium]